MALLREVSGHPRHLTQVRGMRQDTEMQILMEFQTEIRQDILEHRTWKSLLTRVQLTYGPYFVTWYWNLSRTI